jgi:hypothetical protein
MLDRDIKTTRARYFLSLYAVVGMAIVFWVPYFVSMQPTASVSYHFGYNNRAGIILLAFFLGAGAIWTRGVGFPFLQAGHSKAVPLKVLFVTLFAVLMGCVAMYALAGRFGGFGESSYEIDRVWMLSQGKTPYTDFEWPFGASFLYGPLFLGRLFSLDLVRASYIFWGINFLCGTCLLFAVVNMIDYPTTKKTSIFLLMMGAAYPAILSMGTHYALLRHICPVFFVLLVERVVSRDGVKWKMLASFLAAIFTVALLLVSPETAVAHAFACICVFLLDAQRRSLSALSATAVLLGAFALIFWTAARLHVLDTMRASGGGADSFPIIPAPHILLFIAALFLSACYVYQRLVNRSNHDNTIGLIAYSVPMVVASLGRCDPGHVFLNGIGVFLACLFYVSNSPVAWRWCRTAFLCFIIIIPTIAGLWLYRILLANVCLNDMQEGGNSKISDKIISLAQRQIAPHLDGIKRAKLERRLEMIRLHSGVPVDANLSEVYPEWRGEFAAPFGYRPNHIGTYLNSRIDYGFYEGLENANTPAAVRRKIDDLAHHPQDAVLLLHNFDDNCLVDDSGERKLIGILFFFPYPARVIHTDSVYRPLCDYIHEHYKLNNEAGLSGDSYQLWVAESFNDGR